MSPDDLSTALAVYTSTGTYAAAARAVDRDESTVRKALRRHRGAPERAELFAAELAVAHVNALRATRRARRKALAALDVTDDPRDVALLAHVLHENLRAVSTARVAHGRLTAAEQHVEARVGEELRGTLDQLQSALPRAAFDQVLRALDDDQTRADSPMRAVVVQYDANPANLSDQELHRRIARLVESIHGDAAATIATLSAEELDARLRAGLAALVQRARAGDTEARAALAPLVDAAQVPEGAPVVYLPRKEPL